MTEKQLPPTFRRVEFFGTTGSGKSTLARNMLADPSIFSKHDIELRNGRLLWQEVLSHRETDVLPSHGVKHSLKGRFLPGRQIRPSITRIVDTLCPDSPEMNRAFNALLAAYQGTPAGIQFSAGLVGWARNECAVIQCEDYWRNHMGKNGNFMLLYEESLVHLSVGMLKFASSAENYLEKVLKLLPKSELYVYLVAPLEECRAAIERRDENGIQKRMRLDSLLAGSRLYAQAEEHLIAQGNMVMRIDRTQSAQEISTQILSRLVKP
ncbi:hypothetical protein [Roseovarius sp. D22-M7]|uniref:hypothetical protein n=1 Tax=Roseovarius sp. D22-M7 TaxID=3127116 RepID=UPI0030103CB4